MIDFDPGLIGKRGFNYIIVPITLKTFFGRLEGYDAIIL